MTENKFFINHSKYDRVKIGKIGDEYYIAFLVREGVGESHYLWHDGKIYAVCASEVAPYDESLFREDEGYYSSEQEALDKYYEWYERNIESFSRLQGKRKLYYFTNE